MSSRDVVVINPLGASLAHYAGALEALLDGRSASITTETITEPSASGMSRRRWVLEYLRLLRGVGGRHRGKLVIVAWPVLGYWDYALARLLARSTRVWIVMHDPIPLNRVRGTKMVGHGRLARWVAGRALTRASLVLHSREAADAAATQMRLRQSVVLPLPMLAPKRKPAGVNSGSTIRVLGQYKADRDISILEKLAQAGGADRSFEIVGRGWVDVPGWSTVDRFVPEEELERLIESSSAIVIPYRRFFQSDIAVRSLECGTAVVGPRESSLSSLVGQDSRWLATDDWVAATTSAVSATDAEVFAVAERAYQAAYGEWRSWVEGENEGDDRHLHRRSRTT